MRRFITISTLIAISATIIACGGGGHESPPVVSISLTPGTATVTAGQTQQFTAAVSGSSNTSVTYALSGSGCTGAACGTINASGLYTAPSPIPASGTVTVTATAAADTSKTAKATITQTPVAVTISPTTSSLRGADAKQFAATVTGHSNTAVTWAVTGGGSIDSSGLYTAPYAVPSQITATVTATSQFDTTKSASATVTLTPLTLAISPSTSTLYRTKTAQFTATVTNHSNTGVTWSVSGDGTVDSSGLYKAPNVIPQQENVTVTATSQADTSKVASATITLVPLTISVTPGSSILYVGQQMQFVAAVAQSDDTGVTWSLSGANCSGSSCGAIDNVGLYTAPASVTPVAISKQVPAGAGPWISNATTNTNAPFGASPGTPVILNATDGLALTPGAKITVSYVSGMWCINTYVSQSTCRDANGYPEYPTNDTLGGVYGTYAPSKYMDSAAYPVAAMKLAGAFADSKGQMVGNPFPIGNGPLTVTVPDGAKQLQLGANDCDYITARDYYSPLQVQVNQILMAVTVTATSTADPSKTASALVNATNDPNAKLSGAYAFLFQGPGASGTMTALIGHFVADGGGKIAGGVMDSNAIAGTPTVHKSFTGTYEIGEDDRGTLTFSSLPGSPSFSFAIGDEQDKAYAVQIDSTSAHLAGYLRKQHLFNLSTSTLGGDFAFGFYGSTTEGEYDAAVGRMSVDQAGTISAGSMDLSTETSIVFTGTSTLNGGSDDGRGNMTFVIPALGTFHGGFYVVDRDRMFFLVEDQTSVDAPLMVGEMRRQTGTFSSASITGGSVFHYTGVTSSGTTVSTIGILTAGAQGLSGEFDSSNNGDVLAQQPLTASATVDPGGRAVLNTSILGQMVIYLVGDGTGYLLHKNSTGLGLIEKQSFPQDGLTLSSLQGHKTCANTELPVPNTGAFSCTMTWNNSGGWTSVTDATSLPWGNHPGTQEGGQIVLDTATGRFVNTMTTGGHHTGYAVSPGKLVLLCSEPPTSIEAVLWQSVGFWQR